MFCPDAIQLSGSTTGLIVLRMLNTPIMDKSASCKIFEEYVDSLFPIGGKRSRSAVIRQDFAKRIVDHLKGKQDPDASLGHFVKKGGFALLDMPSAAFVMY